MEGGIKRGIKRVARVRLYRRSRGVSISGVVCFVFFFLCGLFFRPDCNLRDLRA
jgi:hypothetical protein